MQLFKNALVYNETILSEIIPICNPLENLGISYFCYMKIFNNGKKLYLSNKIDFLKHMVDKNLSIKQSSILTREITTLQKTDTHCYLWTGTPQDENHRILHHLDIWNGISFYHKLPDCTEMASFATKKENENIINFYIQNKYLLEKFLSFFKEKSFPFINVQKENIFIFNEAKKEEILPIETDNATIEKFLKDIAVKRYYFNNGIHLSRREAESLSYLSTGKTIKEAARLMNLSPRTVETYIINLRNRTRIHEKSNLINLFNNSLIIL